MPLRTVHPQHALVRARVALAGASLVLLSTATACASTPATTPSTPGQVPSTSAPKPTVDAPVPVTAAFYPLAYLLEQVGGPNVKVSSLTKPGVEPHDLELTPQDLVDLPKMSVVAYLKGFQPAVDEAVAQQAGRAAFDVSPAARLDLAAQEEDHDHDHQESTPGSSAAPTEHHETQDPHFWLDPIRYAAVGTALAQRLAEADPSHAADYQARAAALTSSLSELDRTFSAGLKSCATTKLVTGHAAFGYLAARYNLTQVPIAGLSPDQEPSAKKLAEVAATVKAAGVTTIFTETLVDPKFAQTVAKETGASLAVLDPVEGITDQSAGKDYHSVMLANLAALRTGLGCP